MRALSLTSLAALAFVVASCDSTPVEPPGIEADASTPLFKAEQGWEYGIFPTDFVDYVECLGEDIRFYGDVPYKMHEVFNSSGGYSYSFQLLPATPNTPFNAEGLSSGIVWDYRGGTNPQVFHAGPGEVFHISVTETWISKDGPTMKSQGMLHTTINANGEVTVDRFILGIYCTGQQ